jgi:hypothetical protein
MVFGVISFEYFYVRGIIVESQLIIIRRLSKMVPSTTCWEYYFKFLYCIAICFTVTTTLNTFIDACIWNLSFFAAIFVATFVATRIIVIAVWGATVLIRRWTTSKNKGIETTNTVAIPNPRLDVIVVDRTLTPRKACTSRGNDKKLGGSRSEKKKVLVPPSSPSFVTRIAMLQPKA